MVSVISFDARGQARRGGGCEFDQEFDQEGKHSGWNGYTIKAAGSEKRIHVEARQVG